MQHTLPPLPRLLLVEDDLISRNFLLAALQLLPAQVDCADTAAAALQLAGQYRHALWLIDVNLPDASGSDLLARLRAGHPQTPALAHTADTRASLSRQLHGAGFQGVLIKPLGREALLAAVRAQLPAGKPGEVQVPVWDEARALSALNGQHAHLKALRDLFMGELPGVRDALRLAMAQDDAPAIRQQLHRLQASCGFVGAARLGAAARQLHQQPDALQPRRELSAAIEQLLGS